MLSVRFINLWSRGVAIFLWVALVVQADRVQGRESVKQAAKIARQLLSHSGSVGTMATIYPADHPSLAGSPYAMQEYYAKWPVTLSCHANGSLTLILLPISRHMQNILHHPTRGASISVSSDPPDAARARVSLMGTVAVLDDSAAADLKDCYLAQHPDAQEWLPGDENGAHVAYWGRFDPHAVYFVGGFGDEHFIGYIPLGLYQTADQSRGEADTVHRQQVLW